MSDIIKRSKQILLAALCVALIVPQGVFAQETGEEGEDNKPQSQFNIDYSATDVNYWDPRGNGACGANPEGTPVVGSTKGQEANIKIILGVTKSLGLNQKAALVALMTAMQESNITNLANTGVPISLTNPAAQGRPGKDHDSVGVFQQRVSTGWSTYDYSKKPKEVVYQLMTVAYAAEAFLGVPKNAKLPAGLDKPGALKKGLQSIDNWENLPPGVVAQKVQISAYPDAYNKHQTKAQKFIDQYWDQSPPVPLPIPITGGPAANTTDCASTGSFTNLVKRYAHPQHHKANFFEMMPDYAEAVKNAPKQNIYVGGGSRPGIDCGGFVTLLMHNSGIDDTYNNKKGPVTGQYEYIVSHPDKFKAVNPKTTNDLQPGDITINRGKSHTYVFVGKIGGFDGNAASASYGETSRTPAWRTPMASNVSPDDLSDFWFRPTNASANATN